MQLIEILFSQHFSLLKDERNNFLVRKNDLGETCYIISLDNSTKELWDNWNGK